MIVANDKESNIVNSVVLQSVSDKDQKKLPLIRAEDVSCRIIGSHASDALEDLLNTESRSAKKYLPELLKNVGKDVATQLSLDKNMPSIF